MLLKIVSIIVPILVLLLVVLPLVKVFKGQVSALSAKKRIILHVFMFFTLLVGASVLSPIAFAAESTEALADNGMAKGLGYLAAAIATGLSALGAGIAVAAAAPSAIGAISENPKNFGKSLIFVALGEGVAIYGLLISILILNAL